ncbi:ATP-binding protein [Asticcacaulis sp. BYS171W]|uniref:histidine kinase n=1 Tax=Asticcacaulis aquaticus TaxID=2984212 RepID=A0ABT5HXZ3_9CAUL|nr:ATP-binding protein [Asticcacaulis aquaticus]MDC7684945.1 ATP-binding protein [Asticcacaulis aquaticus]
MLSAPLTDPESLRLRALRELDILDSEPDPRFDEVTRLAAELFEVPITAVSLVDSERQWFKSSVGLEVCETSRDVAFCEYAIRNDAVMIVPDATQDARFKDNDLVTGDPGIRFYAGAPVRFDGVLVGTLCVIDTKPRHDFGLTEARRLTALAATISAMMAMRKDGLVKRQVIQKHDETQKKLEMMEAIAGVGYWSVDIAYQTVQWSRGVYAIQGLDPKTYTPNMADSELRYHPDDWPMIKRMLRAAMIEGRPFKFEARMYRTDGQLRNVIAEGSVERDETGKPVALFGVFQDVTEQRLIEDMLTEAKIAAETYAQAQSDFLSNMSHEIRTPLTTIIGYSNLLSETEGLSEEAKGFVGRLQKGSKALLGLVNDVLDFAKLEAGLVVLDPQPTDLRDLVEETCGQFAVQTRAKGLGLHLDYAPDCPEHVLTDDVRLNQVLYNLIGNACKFTAQGDVRIRVAAVSDQPLMLRIEVRDTGPGITEAQQTRLFRRFSQADHSINRQHGGSGLGLAICHEISRLMNGRMGVESVEGEGSCFWLEFPTEALAAPEAVLIDAAPEQGHLNILIADDHPHMRQMLRALLAGRAGAVCEASNGAEAVAASMTQAFDLILMDVHMPVLDGVTAARTIREQCIFNAATPIVALSAFAQDTVWQGTKPLFAEILTKPVDPAALTAALDLALPAELEFMRLCQ